MSEFCCRSCGYIYDPEDKINSGVSFDELSDTWICPACDASKSGFKKLGPEYSETKKVFNEKRAVVRKQANGKK